MPRVFLALLLLLLAPLAPASPEKWTAAIDKLTAADATHPPAKDGVVFIGSSTIGKWSRLPAGFPGVSVIWRGFGGSELADSVFYADRIVIPYRPRVVVLYAGDNDLMAGKSPETVLADFRAFCARIQAALPKTRIVFLAVKPSPARWEIHPKMERANALVAAECARDPRVTFVDVWTPMLDAKGKPRPELYVSDQLHMNESGYAIWVPLVAPHLK